MSRSGTAAAGRGRGRRRSPSRCSPSAWAGALRGRRGRAPAGCSASSAPCPRSPRCRRAPAAGGDRGGRPRRACRRPWRSPPASLGRGPSSRSTGRPGRPSRAILPDGLAAGLRRGPSRSSRTDAPALVALLDAALVAAGGRGGMADRRAAPAGGRPGDRRASGLAYRWTVEPPASAAARRRARPWPRWRSSLALAGWSPGGVRPAAAAPRGARWSSAGSPSPWPPGLGAGPAQAGDPWWAWKDWEVGGSASGASGGGLDLRQRYGQLDWPATPRVAFTRRDRPRPPPAGGEPRRVRRRRLHPRRDRRPRRRCPSAAATIVGAGRPASAARSSPRTSPWWARAHP